MESKDPYYGSEEAMDKGDWVQKHRSVDACLDTDRSFFHEDDDELVVSDSEQTRVHANVTKSFNDDVIVRSFTPAVEEAAPQPEATPASLDPTNAAMIRDVISLSKTKKPSKKSKKKKGTGEDTDDDSNLDEVPDNQNQFDSDSDRNFMVQLGWQDSNDASRRGAAQSFDYSSAPPAFQGHSQARSSFNPSDAHDRKKGSHGRR